MNWRQWEFEWLGLGRSWFLRVWTTKGRGLEFRRQPDKERPGRLRVGTIELTWMRAEKVFRYRHRRG